MTDEKTSGGEGTPWAPPFTPGEDRYECSRCRAHAPLSETYCAICGRTFDRSDRVQVTPPLQQ